MEKKKFSLFSVILSVICVIFVAEAAAPVATLGNSQYFWWIFMIVAFLLPYGLIAAELGTTYQGDGGIYDWINKAYPGTKWGARASWYYWINFPLWMASLAVMCPWLLEIMLGTEFSVMGSLLIQLAFIAIVTVIACYPVSDSIIILNISAIIKVVLAVGVGVLGVYHVMQHGFVNDMSPATFLPSFDVDSLSFISVIIFNLLGFEIVCTYADSMSNPKKQIPQAIVAGGFVIAAVYLFSGFGIGAAVPTDEIQADSGMIEAVMLVTGQETGWLISLVALLFGLTLFGNMISWAMGVNSTSAYAAENNDMPKIFAKRWAKNDMPIGGVFMNAVVAVAVVLLGVVMEHYFPDSSLFWSFFALNLVAFLLSYIPIFPAFYKLRKVDGDTPRPYKVPGGDNFLKLLVVIPVVLIVVSIFFTAFPLAFDAETLVATLPITIGIIIVAIVGEILICKRAKKQL